MIFINRLGLKVIVRFKFNMFNNREKYEVCLVGPFILTEVGGK